jgi:hypothetical protein
VIDDKRGGTKKESIYVTLALDEVINATNVDLEDIPPSIRVL